jgi:hypothetical protein
MLDIIHDQVRNQRFGHLVALSPIGRDRRGQRLWLCLCDCLEMTVAVQSGLRSGHRKSCGCLVGSKTD